MSVKAKAATPPNSHPTAAVRFLLGGSRCSASRTASFHRGLLFCRHISNMDKLGPTWPAEEIFLFFQGVTSPLKPQHTVAAVFLRTRRPRSASKISARANSHAVFALRLRDWCTLCLADSLHILLNDRISRMWQELERPGAQGARSHACDVPGAKPLRHIVCDSWG